MHPAAPPTSPSISTSPHRAPSAPSAWQDYFDSWQVPAPLLDRLLSDLPPAPAVLILSPMRGRAALTLAARLPAAASLTLVEPSPSLCAAARRALAPPQRPSRARVLSAPLTALPLPDASQDLAWCHHLSLQDPSTTAAVLAEARRVLRPGGRLCVLTPDHIYLGRLPQARLLDLSTARARLRAHPVEADRAESSLLAAFPTWQHLLAAGFLNPHLIPLSATRSGPFSPSDAQTLQAALPALGLEDPNEDPSISAFHPDSPFYLLDQPDALLIHHDWLICAASPP